MKTDLFSPYVVVGAIIIYTALAMAGIGLGLGGLEFPSTNTLLYIVAGALFFTAGVFVSSKFKVCKIKQAGDNRREYLLLTVVLVGIILQAINIYMLGGIPLLSGYLKSRAVTRIWFISYILFLPGINLLIASYQRNVYYLLLLVGLLLFALTGYRTTVIVILLSAFITIYYIRRPSFRWIIIFTSIIVIAGILVGYIAVKSIEWQQWSFNPAELLLFRAAYTLTVFDKIVHLQGYTHGKLLYYTLTGYLNSTDPRAIVGEAVLGYRHSTTSLIFGPPLLDFGLHAMALQMSFLGLVLGLMHRIQLLSKGVFTGLYAVILAQTMVWVETGPTDLIVWIFFVMAILSIIYSLWRCCNEGSSCS